MFIDVFFLSYLEESGDTGSEIIFSHKIALYIYPSGILPYEKKNYFARNKFLEMPCT